MAQAMVEREDGEGSIGVGALVTVFDTEHADKSAASASSNGEHADHGELTVHEHAHSDAYVLNKSIVVHEHELRALTNTVVDHTILREREGQRREVAQTVGEVATEDGSLSFDVEPDVQEDQIVVVPFRGHQRSTPAVPQEAHLSVECRGSERHDVIWAEDGTAVADYLRDQWGHGTIPKSDDMYDNLVENEVQMTEEGEIEYTYVIGADGTSLDDDTVYGTLSMGVQDKGVYAPSGTQDADDIDETYTAAHGPRDHLSIDKSYGQT